MKIFIIIFFFFQNLGSTNTPYKSLFFHAVFTIILYIQICYLVFSIYLHPWGMRSVGKIYMIYSYMYILRFNNSDVNESSPIEVCELSDIRDINFPSVILCIYFSVAGATPPPPVEKLIYIDILDDLPNKNNKNNNTSKIIIIIII